MVNLNLIYLQNKENYIHNNNLTSTPSLYNKRLNHVIICQLYTFNDNNKPMGNEYDCYIQLQVV